jgi:hypothetical protein
MGRRTLTVATHAGVDRRLPAGLVGEVRASLQADPKSHRSEELDQYRYQHHHPLAHEMIAAGVDSVRAYSYADIEVRRRAARAVPHLKRFAAADPAIVESIARRQLAQVRAQLRGTARDRHAALSDLRRWGVLRGTIKAAEARHRQRAQWKAEAYDMAATQRCIIHDEVPDWGWPHDQRLAAGLHGFVETNRTGAIHVWTLVADRPLRGAGGQFLDNLPTDRRIRVFGVERGSLSEAMLLRRGFERSRLAWHGLRQGERVQASAWSWMYR